MEYNTPHLVRCVLDNHHHPLHHSTLNANSKPPHTTTTILNHQYKPHHTTTTAHNHHHRKPYHWLELLSKIYSTTSTITIEVEAIIK